MAHIPQIDFGGQRLPVAGPTVAGQAVTGAALAQVGGELLRGAGQLGEAARQLMLTQARVREAADQRAAREALATWQLGFKERYAGRLDEASGEQVAGWNRLDVDSVHDGDGGASGRFGKWNEEFKESEVYSELTARQRELFERAVQPHYVDAAQRVMEVDRRNAEVLSGRQREAALRASSAMAEVVELDDAAGFEGAAERAALDAAVIKLGTEVINPEELYGPDGVADAGRLRFRSDAGRVIFESERDAALKKLRLDRVQRMLDGVAAAEEIPDKMALVKLARATSQGWKLGEKVDAAVTGAQERVEYKSEQERLAAEREREKAEYKSERERAAAEAAEEKRKREEERAAAEAEREQLRVLDDLVAQAEMAEDPETREALAEVAYEAARAAEVRPKVLAAVKGQRDKLKEQALKEERELALGMLASGGDYEGYMGAEGKNRRREEAGKWAAQKVEELRAKELAAARSAQAKELNAMAKYRGELLKSGIYFDGKGEPMAVTGRDAQAIAQGELARGQIPLGEYSGIKRALEAQQKSGQAERYQAAAQMVVDALGTELELVWRGGRMELGAKDAKKPEQVVGKYRVPVVEARVVPEMEVYDIDVPPGLLGGFMATKGMRMTGKMQVIEREVAKKKAKILARDVPRIIDVVVALQGEDMEGAALELLGDLREGLIAVDLDARLDMLQDGLMREQRAGKIREGRALQRALMLGVPAGGGDVEGEE